MAPTTTPTMTVLHLESGHILAAVSSGSRTVTVTVTDLTGGKHLAVRLPGSGSAQINVTAELLTAKSVPLDDDVLSRPLEFQVSQGSPAVTFTGKPIAWTTGTKIGSAGQAVVSLWQAGDQLEVARGVLDANGHTTGTVPPGATHGLLVVADEPLAYKV
jgi:hypothetical protein